MEATTGYWEYGYAFIDGQGKSENQSYHNFTVSFSRRYFNLISNAMRLIVNTGQNLKNTERTADGFVFLLENSWITPLPSTLVPYSNFWVGYHRPQSVARDAAAQGVLKNTGLLFETDNLTNFPKLDDTARDTCGGALGCEYLFNLEQQIVLEVAYVGTMETKVGDKKGRTAKGDQFGVELRYQIPIDKSWILRVDGMYGHRDRQEDLAGVRFEIRAKF